MEIFKADDTFLSQIMELYRKLFDEMAEIDPERFKSAEQNTDFIGNIIASETADVLLAEKNDEIVGLALVLEDETPDYSCLVKRKTAVLMDLIVGREKRKAGVGSALLKASKDWAASHHAEYLQLNVLAKNTQALGLYEQLGLESTMVTMECRL